MEAKEIQNLAKLAKLEINDETLEQTAKSINEVLSLVDQLQAVDTDDVLPMAHPLDAVQTLRKDVVSEADRRNDFQAIAPATEDGLYLVPKVIE
nr:Asp-tRNA(Asn)/Glu-tRNA(Gln) amidotransferase subunit GatC [Agarilytica rhodophyticola]